VTSSEITHRLEKYGKHIKQLDPTQDILEEIKGSHLIIGAGRVAAEALLVGRPVFAIGEAKSLGLITLNNLDEALKSNFGDIGPKELQINFDEVKDQIENFVGALNNGPNPILIKLQTEITTLRSKIDSEFNLVTIVDKLERIYQTAVVDTLKRETPILMYHRFIAHESEKGVHGTWMHEHRFENHLRLIKALGYETITFRDLEEKGFIHRLEPNKRYLIITADDGYRDNLTRMLPLLEKYEMKAVVFIVSNETHNRWDTDHPTNPDVRADLLSPSEIKALDDSGRVEIGGHTSSHAKLDELSPLEQRREITENKNRLESILRHPIISFAYPYGSINENAKSEVQAAGYRYAVATDSGPRQMHLDPFQIRRIAVFPRTSTFGLWRKIRGNYVWRR
jgi:peptidoglycan/xylan/chitin deacetylase (PgdA/CDA1 family)